MITFSSFLAMVAAPILVGGLLAAVRHAFVSDDRSFQYKEETVAVRPAAPLRVCN